MHKSDIYWYLYFAVVFLAWIGLWIWEMRKPLTPFEKWVRKQMDKK